MRYFGALVLLVFLGSCTTARIPTEKPGSLHEVNELLGGRWAVISKTDGRRIRNVKTLPSDTLTPAI